MFICILVEYKYLSKIKDNIYNFQISFILIMFPKGNHWNITTKKINRLTSIVAYEMGPPS